MAHGENVAPTATGASDATPARLPAHLTPAEYAVLAGMSTRSAQRMIERGEFPTGSVIRVGASKHYRQARLLTAKLLEAGWLVPGAVLP